MSCYSNQAGGAPESGLWNGLHAFKMEPYCPTCRSNGCCSISLALLYCKRAAPGCRPWHCACCSSQTSPA